MLPYHPVAEHETLLLTLSTLAPSSRQSYWSTVERELTSFDTYCTSAYAYLQTRLFNIIVRFNDQRPDLLTIEQETDATRDAILDFHDLIGNTFKFFVRLKHKFDKRCGITSGASEFADEMLGKYKFCDIGMGDFVCMLSDIYFTLKETKRIRELEATGGKKGGEPWVPPSAFVRSTRKYWVKLEDLTKLKLSICKHLPLLRFGKKQGLNLGQQPVGGKIDFSQFDNSYNGNGEGDASSVTSVYFDNDKLNLYHDKMVRKEGATLIRIRWYGDEGRTCFMECKTWHDSWVLNDSIKERFDLKWEQVSAFLTGSLSARNFVEQLRGKGKYDYNSLCEIFGLAEAIQSRIKKLQLHPAIRTSYSRTAFQNSDNNNIRISIDTSLELSKEPRHIGPNRWCRDTSVGIPPSEKFVFPMAVLEIKLHSISDTPYWIQEIVNSDYVVGAYKFSKFMHGTAKLNGINTKVLPSWFNRTCTHVPGYPLKHWYRQSIQLEPNKMDFDGVIEWESLQEKEIPQHMLTKSNFFEGKESDWSSSSEELDGLSEEDESDDRDVKLTLLGTSKKEKKLTPRKMQTRSMRMNAWMDDQEELYWKIAEGQVDPKDFPTVELTGTIDKGGPSLAEIFSKNKKPHRVGITPVLQAIRYEPKTNLALERTFLSWQRQFHLLAVMAIGLCSILPYPHSLSLIGLVVFGMVLGVYSLMVFQFRRKAIRTRSVDGHYDDVCGPTVLTFVLLIVLGSLVWWNFSFIGIAPGALPASQSWTRDYRVPLSLSPNSTGDTLASYLNTILMDLQKNLPTNVINGNIGTKLGNETYTFWDTVPTCRLWNNGFRLTSVTGVDTSGVITTNMALEYVTWDNSFVQIMDTAFPSAGYHVAEYFRPPSSLTYSRQKILPIIPGLDVSILRHVANQFGFSFYLWDFINQTTWDETLRMISITEKQLVFQVYGNAQISLGIPTKSATLSAYVWFNLNVPIYMELSLSFPIYSGEILTTSEINTASSIFRAIQNLPQAKSISTDIADFVYGSFGACN